MTRIALAAAVLACLLAACDSLLDPVETVSLCKKTSGVISRNCAVCQEPPYSARCPQCQGDAGERDAQCESPSTLAGKRHDGGTDAAISGSDGSAARDGGGKSPLDAAVDASTDDDAGSSGCPKLCDAKKPVCDGRSHQCVECVKHAQCPASAPRCDPTAHTCGPCTSDGPCEGRTLPVCDTSDDGESSNGQCVRCLGSNYDCGQAKDGKAYVCDSAQRTCTKLEVHSAVACQPCVSDDECLTGQACVVQTFGSPAETVGSFCFWLKSASTGPSGSGNCDNVRPYVHVEDSLVSVDGAPVTVCMPRASTCIAYNDLGKACALATNGTKGDSTRCGFQHSAVDPSTHINQDGFCTDIDPTGAYSWKCDLPCVNDALDCPGNIGCNSTETPPVCDL
ncbi:MAG TPA: hypothetical protein VHM19_03605 [Polyangiales bacterium]|nr:hypothetical protein [Polyangiales bacterium]